MAKFVLKSDLPIKTQEEIDRVSAIPSAQRLTSEANFLTALAPYLTNEVIKYDDDNLIVSAAGLTLPTGLTGFKKGALFTKKDATGNGLYLNTGDETSAAWDLVDEASTANIPDGAVTIPKLGPNVVLPINHIVYVDGSRTDSYTANGSILTPYKTIKAAQDAINAIAATLYDSQAHFDTCRWVVNIAPGKYTDNIDIVTVRHLIYNMQDVEISGNVGITQEQLGLSDYYGKVEFRGTYGNRAKRGKCGLISGDITFNKTAYDSLAYDAFIGIEVTGDVKYGAAAGEGHGTWVLYLRGSEFSNSAKSITTNFAAGSHCVLIETDGWNDIQATLTGVIDLYDVNGGKFKNINTTPANDNKVKNAEFSGTVSIVASKNLKLDATSYKSLKDRTPTLTGMTIVFLDDQMPTPVREFFVDGSRTDTYTENGTQLRPYKTIAAAQTAINAIAATLYDTQEHFDSCQFVVNIAQGKYTDAIAISTVRYLRYNMQGVEISGAVNITQEQLGLGDYYGKVEFFGGYGNRSEKGKAGKISGDITFLKTAYDSLAYDAFIGIEITGDVKYGATAGTGYGTWILYLENTSFSNTAKSITTNFAAGGHCLLIETFGFNEIKSTLTGVIDLYDCNNTYFRNIDITPANGCKVKNSEFTGSVSIVASKNLQMDLNSMISMYARTPTLTGMTVLPLDGQAEITVPLSAANIIAMYGAPVTIVPAVTGKTIVIDDICLKMVRTSTQFTGGGAVEFRYTNGSGDKVTADIAAGVITGAAGTVYTINKSIITSLTGVVSSPIVITNADGAFADGTGAGVLTIRYHLI